jgi:hypothetical protein
MTNIGKATVMPMVSKQLSRDVTACYASPEKSTRVACYKDWPLNYQATRLQNNR